MAKKRKKKIEAVGDEDGDDGGGGVWWNCYSLPFLQEAQGSAEMNFQGCVE